MVFGTEKEKIDLVLEKTSFTASEKIAGKVLLFLPKIKKARALKVIFRGIEREYSKQFDDPTANVSTVHYFELELDKEKEYSGNYSYDFELIAPKIANQKERFETQMENTLQQYDKTAFGGIFRAASIIGKAYTPLKPVPKIEWYLEAKLDVPGGIDISTEIQIQIS